MNSRPSVTRVMLLVEDNPGDAQLVADLVGQADRDGYQIVHVPRLSEAVHALRSLTVDVVVLDLHLPDCQGVDSVRAVRTAAGAIPIVVLTGSNDEVLAMKCIDAGAQDYLAKDEARAQNLKRAIGYAISRVREAQLHELQDLLARYRSLSSSAQTTTVTAAIAGSGAVSVRYPDLFHQIVKDYLALLAPGGQREIARVETSRAEMERIVTMIGDATGGPRDLLDVHVGALERAIAQMEDSKARALVYEARLLALEMMGLLVDYYRVGYRRRSVEGVRT